jgi:hypothetical protein
LSEGGWKKQKKKKKRKNRKKKNLTRDNGYHTLGAVLLDNLGGFGEGAARVGNVVDEHGDLVLDLADKNLWGAS